MEYSWQAWCLGTLRYPKTIEQDPYHTPSHSKLGTRTELSWRSPSEHIKQERQKSSGPCICHLLYHSFSDFTHIMGMSLCDTLMTSCIATTLSCHHVMLWWLHTLFGAKPICIHTCIRAAVPPSEHVCWCVHAHDTHMVTNCDPKPIPWHMYNLYHLSEGKTLPQYCLWVRKKF